MRDYGAIAPTGLGLFDFDRGGAGIDEDRSLPESARR
jgi:hypothetical protein